MGQKHNKRKLDNASSSSSSKSNTSLQWSKKLTPSYLLSPQNASPRMNTVSIAIPSSVLQQQSTKELKTIFIGHIARIAAITEIDEIIIFIDNSYELQIDKEKRHSTLFSRLLQYLDCPPYLRKSVFPFSSDLKFAGLCTPLGKWYCYCYF